MILKLLEMKICLSMRMEPKKKNPFMTLEVTQGTIEGRRVVIF